VPKLSVTIITWNEARNIVDAIASVAWADEIVIVDARSSDETVALATAAHARVRVVVRDWPGYVAQKNFAAREAAHDWILSLDADERVTPELAAEVQSALASPQHAAYEMARVTWHLGRWIRATDWYPDYQSRLYDRRHAAWTGRHVHEALSLDGPKGRLRGELHHFPYRDLSDHLDTIDRYTTLAARQMHESGRRSTPLELVFNGPLAFVRNYVLKGGFRLGSVGLIVSAMNAYYVFLKSAKLWQLQSSPRSQPAAAAGAHSEGPAAPAQDQRTDAAGQSSA
jgi:glycosyltransferase involved in cell wall biosynthesis